MAPVKNFIQLAGRNMPEYLNIDRLSILTQRRELSP